MVRGRTFYVATTGLVFLAPVRFRAGDLLDLEIFVCTTQSVRCKARVTTAVTPVHVQFLEFASGDLKIWNDSLLRVRRARAKKA